MKTAALFCALMLGLPITAPAAEAPAKVSISAKKIVLDSDHDLRGRFGNSRHKTITLRVEITNTQQEPISLSEVQGVALVERSVDQRERLVRESLGTQKLQILRPGEKTSIDLGKIRLNEMEWGNRKFEESLKGWKVVCSQGTVEIGKALSDAKIEEQLQEAKEVAKKPEQKPAQPGPRPIPQPRRR